MTNSNFNYLLYREKIFYLLLLTNNLIPEIEIFPYENEFTFWNYDKKLLVFYNLNKWCVEDRKSTVMVNFRTFSGIKETIDAVKLFLEA